MQPPRPGAKPDESDAAEGEVTQGAPASEAPAPEPEAGTAPASPQFSLPPPDSTSTLPPPTSPDEDVIDLDDELAAAPVQAAAPGADAAPRSAKPPLPPKSAGNASPHKVIGRYALYGELATGGMATVFIGRLVGPVGFSRTVAIKRLHRQYAKDPEFTTMFLDEARVAARIRHPNVVPTLDVVALEGELFLVMEYVLGESLSVLMKTLADTGERMPVPVAANVVAGVLHGLHAAHEAKSERGEPLGIVHRDVSPQNVIVGTDGVARVLDFGVAKAAGRVQSTREGQLKGKLAYMAPEQVAGRAVSRQSDVFAAAAVLWEALVGRRLFRGENEADTLYNVLQRPIDPPSALRPEIPAALDAIVLRGLERDRAKRYQSAFDMAVDLEKAVSTPPAREIGEWVESVARGRIETRVAQLAQVESVSAIEERRSSRPPVADPDDSSLSGVPRSPPLPRAAEGESTSLTQTSAVAIPGERRRRSMVVAVLGVAVLLLGVALVMNQRSEAPEAAPALPARVAEPSPPVAEPTEVPRIPPPPAASSVAASAEPPDPPPPSSASAPGPRPAPRTVRAPRPAAPPAPRPAPKAAPIFTRE